MIAERGQAADGELLSAFQERTAVEIAMDIFIEKIEHFLRKIAGLHAVHSSYPRTAKISHLTGGGPGSVTERL